MDDQPPPPKKSRFFEGKSLLGSLLHRSSSSDKSKSKDERKENSNRQHTQRPSLLDAARLRATTPTTSMSADSSTRITPTAAAFGELSVDEKSSRPKGVYGTDDLLEHRNERNGQAREQENVSTKTATTPSPPWMSAIQQRDQRSSSVPESTARADNPSHFTFRSALQPAVLYPQSGQLPLSQNFPASNNDASLPQEQLSDSRLIRTPPFTSLNVQKQRNKLPAVPHTPITASFPRLPGINAPAPSHTSSRLNSIREVDIDRNHRGQRLPNQTTSTGFTNLPHHATATPARLYNIRSKWPENELSSPGRMERAGTFAGRKRKRGGVEMPAPAYVYTRTNDPNFSIFQGILLYPELCFHLASHLPVADLNSLYAISRDFHTILDTRFTTVILTQALKKAPISSRIFPFRSYAQLCRKDPAARIPHPDPIKAARGVVRSVPSFRWLKMIIFREKTTHAIMALFAERGVPLPRRCELALKKIWFMLDIPDNARRIGYIHNTQLFLDLDLYFAACFFVKLDMLFTDPIAGSKRVEGRRLIMCQRSLTKLLEVLKGEALATRWQIVQAWVEWKYESVDEIDNEVDEEETMFGVARADWGRLRREYWGRKLHPNGVPMTKEETPMLLRPDQLIVREAARRGLQFAGHYVRFMLYGYVHPKTMEDFEPRDMTRWIGEYNEDDYTVDDVVAGTQALSVQDGGDPLLDLGPKFKASQSIKRPEISRVEREQRAKEQAFIDGLYAESEQERRDMGLL